MSLAVTDFVSAHSTGFPLLNRLMKAWVEKDCDTISLLVSDDIPVTIKGSCAGISVRTGKQALIDHAINCATHEKLHGSITGIDDRYFVRSTFSDACGQRIYVEFEATIGGTDANPKILMLAQSCINSERVFSP